MFRILLIVIFFSFSLVSVSKANFDVKARTAILQDYHSGEILYEKEPDISIYPASMTKIMTAIIAFDLIKSGDLSFCLLYTSPSPRDVEESRMPSSA